MRKDKRYEALSPEAKEVVDRISERLDRVAIKTAIKLDSHIRGVCTMAGALNRLCIDCVERKTLLELLAARIIDNRHLETKTVEEILIDTIEELKDVVKLHQEARAAKNQQG